MTLLILTSKNNADQVSWGKFVNWTAKAQKNALKVTNPRRSAIIWTSKYVVQE